jgi:hypothetical protein
VVATNKDGWTTTSTTDPNINLGIDYLASEIALCRIITSRISFRLLIWKRRFSAIRYPSIESHFIFICANIIKQPRGAGSVSVSTSIYLINTGGRRKLLGGATRITNRNVQRGAQEESSGWTVRNVLEIQVRLNKRED